MKFSTSVNIERDNNKVLNYIVTANARQAIGTIVNSFTTGIHSFCLIGSYGTGKSSFILALQNCLSGKVTGKNLLFNNKGQFNEYKNFEFLNIVGDYQPLISLLQKYVSSSDTNEKNFFNALDNLYKKVQKQNKFLFIVIDEFGKVLEHAAKNNPEKEMYFLQKFCEYVNDTSKNIILLTTLHQSFSAYAKGLKLEQKQEWTKVKGRIQDIVFKEPIEQLLNLAAIRIAEKRNDIDKVAADKLYDLAINTKFANGDLKKDVAVSLYPMDVFSAYVLTQANQRYGQNERTLFTFLEQKGEGSISSFNVSGNRLYNLAKVHDYIIYNFHSFLNEANTDSTNWSGIKVAIERVEGLNLSSEDIEKSISLVKVIGLLGIFASSSMVVDLPFLEEYASLAMGYKDIAPIVKKLEQTKIIRFAKYKSKYILFEGTDVDIEMGLYNASVECKRTEDFIDKLKSLFEFKVSIANSHYYRTGTPRFFEYQITSTPISKFVPNEIDGVINLVFCRKEDISQIEEQCLSYTGLPIAYCIFKNSDLIIDHIFEIDKLNWVRDYYVADENDKVANKEIDNLLEYEKSILNKIVIDSLFSNNVEWIFNGKSVEAIDSQKNLIRFVSHIADTIYFATPIFKNELINKHKPSGTMTVARHNFLLSLLENRNKADIGFEADKFPPEKSIYLTLVKHTGMHKEEPIGYSFGAPTEVSFKRIWDAGEEFLKSTQGKPRKLGDLQKILLSAPYGLKRGLVDCWLPTFLIAKKNDYALYSDNTFVPSINREVLELIQRTPNSFTVKSFKIEGVKQVFFDKYREAINLRETSLSDTSFVETIKPFLVFYNRLDNYAKTTKDISTNAKKFRDVISKAVDPEKTFFEDLPEALGFKEVVLAQNPEAIDSFVSVLHDCIRSLRSCYDDFIKSIEEQILKVLKIKETDFTVYKPIINNRYKFVKVELMPNDIKNFYSRLIGNYDDRKNWIESICFVILNKALDKIKDSEKSFLLMSLKDRLFQLDDYVEMHKSSDENIVRLHITQNKDAALTKQIVLSDNANKDMVMMMKRLEEVLGDDDNLNIAAMINLIKEKLK